MEFKSPFRAAALLCERHNVPGFKQMLLRVNTVHPFHHSSCTQGQQALEPIPAASGRRGGHTSAKSLVFAKIDQNTGSF